MVLVNGAEGIGTGWSTNIPNFNPLDIVNNIRKLLKDEPMIEMMPYYRNFVGTVTKLSPGKYQTDGVWEETETDLHITELPVGTWTYNYKSYIDSLKQSNLIDEYDDCNTDKTINIKIHYSKKLKNKKLSTLISTNNMICFDPNHKIKKYETPEEIIKEFYYVRLTFYLKRKEKLLEILKERMLKNENKVRFIKAVVSDQLIINKKKRKDIISELEKENYEPFDNYNYLLSMELYSLTFERIEKLNEEYEQSRKEYESLLRKTPKDLWNEDLDEFEEKYIEFLHAEEEEYEKLRNGSVGTLKPVKKKSKLNKTVKISERKTTITKTTPTKKTVKKSVTTEKSVSTKRAKITKIEPQKRQKIKKDKENTTEIKTPLSRDFYLKNCIIFHIFERVVY